MATVTIGHTPVQADINGVVEAYMKASIELRPSFESLLAPQAHMWLGRLLDGRLRVVEPFSVGLSQETGQFLADAQEVGEVGIGATLSDAVRDLQATLTELYFALERDQDRLGADMAKVLAVMRQKVARRA